MPVSLMGTGRATYLRRDDMRAVVWHGPGDVRLDEVA